MVVAIGAPAPFAWANALNGDPAAAAEVGALVAKTSDERIAAELVTAGVDIEDLLPYE